MDSRRSFALAKQLSLLVRERGAEEAADLIRWANVKQPRRAIEKAVRSYGQDPSYLVDLCRQTLLFDNPADLCAGLRAIANDQDVIIMRVKNRMPPPEARGAGPELAEQASTTGYRDVAVNLRVAGTGEEGRAAAGLGLERHVCEVQLQLLSMSDVKANDGHARYIQWRNIRGE